MILNMAAKTSVFVGLSVLLCLTSTAVSVRSKCRVSSFRIIGSFSTNCDIQFGYTTAPPKWIDQLRVVESFRNATDEQLDAFAKEACRCRMLRVHRHCPSDLFELIRGVAWRCFPGAREAVSKGRPGLNVGALAAQGKPSGERLSHGTRTLQLGGDGSGGEDFPTTGEKEEIGEEKLSTSVPFGRHTASDGTTGFDFGNDKTIDVTSERPADVLIEKSSENDLEDATEVPTTFEAVDIGSGGESLETFTEGGIGASSEDITEERGGGSTRVIDDDNNATDTGSGDGFDE